MPPNPTPPVDRPSPSPSLSVGRMMAASTNLFWVARSTASRTHATLFILARAQPCNSVGPTSSSSSPLLNFCEIPFHCARSLSLSTNSLSVSHDSGPVPVRPRPSARPADNVQFEARREDDDVATPPARPSGAATARDRRSLINSRTQKLKAFIHYEGIRGRTRVADEGASLFQPAAEPASCALLLLNCSPSPSRRSSQILKKMRSLAYKALLGFSGHFNLSLSLSSLLPFLSTQSSSL